MKDRIVLMLIVLFAFSTFFLVNTNSISAMTKDEIDAQKQSKLIEKFERELDKLDMTIDDINDVGDLYFKEEKVFLHLDSSNKDTKRLQKLKKIVDQINGENQLSLLTESVAYSYDELLKIQDEFVKSAMDRNFVDYLTYIDSETNRVKVEVEELSEGNSFLNEYKNNAAIVIETNEDLKQEFHSEPEAAKSRIEDWNSLGAGIGIKVFGPSNTATCSTAGIAKKGSSLWVMTAGHCNDKGDTFYQYNTRLGTTHLDATASDFDFLLINVNATNIARYATNGLYNDVGDTSTGYDGELTGDFLEKTGLKVCKVGITTDRTCGEISRVGVRRGWLGSNIAVTEVRNDGSLLSKEGDSGGAWFTQSRPYRLVGIHQGGNKNLADSGSSVSYFTPWHLVRDKYGLTLYTSSSSTRMN